MLCGDTPFMREILGESCNVSAQLYAQDRKDCGFGLRVMLAHNAGRVCILSRFLDFKGSLIRRKSLFKGSLIC